MDSNLFVIAKKYADNDSNALVRVPTARDELKIENVVCEAESRHRFVLNRPVGRNTYKTD